MELQQQWRHYLAALSFILSLLLSSLGSDDIVAMAQDHIVLDMTGSVSNYMKFIRTIRQRAADPNRFSHNLPVLPFPPLDRQQTEYITLELRAAGDGPLLVKLKRHDLYLVGYQMQNGIWFEFPNVDNVHLIQNSRFLPFGESYQSLGGLDENSFKVGYDALFDAITNLLITNDNKQRRGYLRILIVMLCKATRFDKLFDKYASWVRKRDDKGFLGWMKTLIHNWGDLSEMLLMSDHDHVDFPLPVGPDGTPHPLSKDPLNINSIHDAVLCLGLLLGTFRPDDLQRVFATSNSSISDALVLSVGSPMVEIFSIQINDIDGENPGDLYGTIQIVDGLGSFDMYNRSRNDYESIQPGETTTLVGPYRSISVALFFTIILDLKDKDSDASPDDEVNKDYIYWDIDLLTIIWNKYNKPLSNVVNGMYGKATVYYVILLEALEATIQVVLVNGDGEKPANVYGSVVAH